MHTHIHVPCTPHPQGCATGGYSKQPTSLHTVSSTISTVHTHIQRLPCTRTFIIHSAQPQWVWHRVWHRWVCQAGCLSEPLLRLTLSLSLSLSLSPSLSLSVSLSFSVSLSLSFCVYICVCVCGFMCRRRTSGCQMMTVVSNGNVGAMSTHTHF